MSHYSHVMCWHCWVLHHGSKEPERTTTLLQARRCCWCGGVTTSRIRLTEGDPGCEPERRDGSECDDRG